MEINIEPLPTDTGDQNTYAVQPLIDNANRTACRLNILGGLLAEAAPESTVRSAAREAQILILEANTAQLMRQDIADLIRAVHQSADSGSHLDAEDKHLLNHMYCEIKRSGATLQNEEARNRLKEVKAEIDQLQLAAVKTLTDGDTGGLWFSGDELLGMSPKVLDSLKKMERKFHDRHVRKGGYR
ncbi:hypothetical protein NLG97_g1030 [Lecanicillium saksenae]|uniref:Uncharacterized protein n=1 Tax=Lecanicillium saksenae TaxID=468837 RepID=A0ACC1R5J0_9HYPO|nr:hypothetical protein NLG97_g1030 [Lecanicillium saksenae]